MTNNDELALKARDQHLPARYYLAECQECGEIMPSNKLHESRNTMAGDSDCYCPYCNAADCDIDDLGTGDEPAARVWNFQQKRIEALLAERDADKKVIADSVVLFETLRQRIAELESVNSAAEKLVRCKGRYHSEQNYRALAALFGVKTPELPPLEGEARTVSVKLLDCDYAAVQHMSGGSSDYCNGFVDGTQNAIKRFKANLAAAGIKLNVGE